MFEHIPTRLRGIEGCKDHIFCYKCIIKWLSSGAENANRCPICRSEVLSTEDDLLLFPIEDIDADNEQV